MYERYNVNPYIKYVDCNFFWICAPYSIMSASRTPNALSARNEDEDLSLETSDLVNVLKGNYSGEIGQFVCNTKAKALVNVYDRVSNKSVIDHARRPSEIKKIVPWDDNTSPLPEYFESVLEDEVWIKSKIDQIAAQIVACGLNHESSSILLDYFRDHLYAAQLGECTEVRDRALAATLASEEQNSINN